jgi:hypothetical protein
MLGILFRLIFVEQGEDLPHHHAHRVIAQVLRDTDEPHAMSPQAAYLKFQSEVIARETAEGMNDNDVEGRRFGGRHVEHSLKLRPAVIHTARSRFDELDRDIPTTRGAKGDHLPSLIRY